MEARQKRKWQQSCWLGLTKGSSAGRIPSPVHNLLPVGSTMPSEHSSREKNIFIPSPFFLLSSSFSFMTFSVTSDKLPGLSARQIFRQDSKRTTAPDLEELLGSVFFFVVVVYLLCVMSFMARQSKHQSNKFLRRIYSSRRHELLPEGRDAVRLGRFGTFYFARHEANQGPKQMDLNQCISFRSH